MWGGICRMSYLKKLLLLLKMEQRCEVGCSVAGNLLKLLVRGAENELDGKVEYRLDFSDFAAGLHVRAI